MTKIVHLNPADIFYPNKDFVLLFKIENIDDLNVNIGKGLNNKICASISFIPGLSDAKITDQELTTMNPLDKDNFVINYDSVNSEYIFIIDRSYSMGGSRI